MVEYTEEQRRKWLASLDARPSSAAILMENDQGQALIVKTNYKKHWTIPGGVIDPGEPPHAAAIREVKEEVNIDVLVEDLSLMAVAQRETSGLLTYQFLFYAKLPDSTFEAIELLDGEIVKYKFVSRQEVLSSKEYIHWSTQFWAEGRRGYAQFCLVDEADGAKREELIQFIGQL